MRQYYYKVDWPKLAKNLRKFQLIRSIFCVDKFSRTIVQNLYLRKIARKYVLNFFNFAHNKGRRLQNRRK